MGDLPGVDGQKVYLNHRLMSEVGPDRSLVGFGILVFVLEVKPPGYSSGSRVCTVEVGFEPVEVRGSRGGPDCCRLVAHRAVT